jgi:HNH endonuclease
MTRLLGDRFWEKVQMPSLPDGCMEWMAHRSVYGYGRFKFNGVQVGAHRLSWIITNGPIPKNMQIDHLCRNRGCVRPDHLDLVTQKENVLRSEAPSAKQAKQTHCKRGHELSGDNIYQGKYERTGIRDCISCQRLRYRKSRGECCD